MSGGWLIVASAGEGLITREPPVFTTDLSDTELEYADVY